MQQCDNQLIEQKEEAGKKFTVDFKKYHETPQG